MNFLKSPSARRPEVRRADRTRRHLGLEPLETRQVLSTFTVSNLNDSGANSLRDAILQADRNNGANTINFSPSLTGMTIKPMTALPQLNDQGGLTINGLGETSLTIDLSNSSRTDSGDGGFANATGNGLLVAYRSAAAVENLALLHASGRGVENDGTATLLDVYVSDSHNGGVVNFGTMTIKDSEVAGNTAWHYGGGVDNSHGTLTVQGSGIDDNAAPEGAGIDAYGGTVSIVSDGSRYSTIELNGMTATGGDGGGIYMSDNAHVSLTGGWVADNRAADGGGIHNDGGVLAATNVSFYNNSAMYGGAIDDYSASATPAVLTGCDIEDNTASVAGGGIYVDGATIQLSASTTLMNNSAPWGSDIYGSYRRTS